MARDKTELTDLTPAVKRGADELKWEKAKVAEDEISILWRETARIETSEQASEAARETQEDNFWPEIEALADFCDKILSEHELPRAAQLVRHDGAGKWWRHPPDSPEHPSTGEIWKLTRGKALAQEFSEDFSDPWYAGRIGFECRLALEHFRKGDAGKPFLFSKIFAIATLRNDWQWRRGHKPSIITGKKQHKNLKQIRDNKNRIASFGVAQRRAWIAEMMKEQSRTGGALDYWLKKQLFTRYDITVALRTVREDRKALRN
jgi:hypothetical protein